MSTGKPGFWERVRLRRAGPRAQAFLGTGLLLLLLLPAWRYAGDWYEKQLIREQKATVAADVSLLGNNLSAALARRLARLQALDAFVRTELDTAGGSDAVDLTFQAQFEAFSSGLFAAARGIRAFTVSPGGIVRYVYPEAGNEVLLGLDLINDPRPRMGEDVQRALRTRQITLSEPFELLQGGMGMAARLAVFRNEQFWGLVTITLDLSALLDEAGLTSTSGNLQLAVRDGSGHVFFGSESVFRRDPVVTNIGLPEGGWELAGVPVRGWAALTRTPVFIFRAGSLIIIALVSGLVYLGLSRQSTLVRAVQQRTYELSAVNEALQRDIAGRARMETALRESEARFRALFEEAPLGIAIENLDFAIIDANRQLQQMLGYDLAALRQMTWPDLIHPEDRLQGQTGSQALLSSARPFYQQERLFIRQDRSALWGRLTVYPVKDAVGRPWFFITMIEDISVQRQAEEQLREKEAQYRNIFEATSDGVFINDFQGNLVDFNPAAHLMHGYSRAEFEQLKPADFIHPESRHLFEEYLRAVQEHGDYRVRAVDVRKDGTPFYVEVTGSRFTYRGQPHALAVVRDVTERVLAFQLLEQRVAERTHELATLLKVANSLATTLKLPELLSIVLQELRGVIRYDAAAVYLLEGQDILLRFNYTGPLDESTIPVRWPITKVPHSRIIIDDRQPIIVADTRDNSPEAQAWRTSVAEMLGEAPAYVAAWMGVPLIAGEKAIGVLSFDSSRPNYFTPRLAELALAIASQAAVAIENARLYDEAQRASALAERQRLARELHDSVSQALYGIALGARTARALLDRDPGQVKEPLDYVLSLAEAGLTEMRALIFELRPETLEAEGLVAVLAKLAASAQARHGVLVTTHFGDEPEVRLGIKEALYRVAQEALNNTIKHAQARAVTVWLDRENGFLQLRVTDDGLGFEPTADFPGHLGLKSMRERIERFGGSLHIASSAGQGTTVCARVPMSQR